MYRLNSGTMRPVDCGYDASWIRARATPREAFGPISPQIQSHRPDLLQPLSLLCLKFGRAVPQQDQSVSSSRNHTLAADYLAFIQLASIQPWVRINEPHPNIHSAFATLHPPVSTCELMIPCDIFLLPRSAGGDLGFLTVILLRPIKQSVRAGPTGRESQLSCAVTVICACCPPTTAGHNTPIPAASVINTAASLSICPVAKGQRAAHVDSATPARRIGASGLCAAWSIAVPGADKTIPSSAASLRLPRQVGPEWPISSTSVSTVRS